MFRRACVAQTLVLGRKRNVRRTKFCEKGKGRGRAAKHLHSVPKTKLVPKNSTKFLAASQWPARYRTMYLVVRLTNCFPAKAVVELRNIYTVFLVPKN